MDASDSGRASRQASPGVYVGEPQEPRRSFRRQEAFLPLVLTGEGIRAKQPGPFAPDAELKSKLPQNINNKTKMLCRQAFSLRRFYVCWLSPKPAASRRRLPGFSWVRGF